MSESIYKDLYKSLGLTEAAGKEELRQAYLALVVKHHPDRNPGDPAAEKRFKQISEAYAILSDPEAKIRYRRMRETAGARAASSSSSSGQAGPRQSASPDDFADWLKKRKRAEASKGGFWDAILGLIPGTEAYARRGLERFNLACKLCLNPRQAAEGLALEIDPSIEGDHAGRLSLHIPAGAKDGDCFRIAGRGYAGPGVGRGDLFITVKVNR